MDTNTEHWVNGDRVTVARPADVAQALNDIVDGHVVDLGSLSLEALRWLAFTQLIDLEYVMVTVTAEDSHDVVERFRGVRQGLSASPRSAEQLERMKAMVLR